jgi:hypothetical protein
MTEKPINLKTIIRNKINDKKIGRFGKKQNELMLDKKLEKIGLDIDTLKNNLKKNK